MAEGTTWSKKFGPLAVPTADPVFFTLGVPQRGTLDRFVVSQEAGELEGYKVDLFDSVAIQEAENDVDEEHSKVFQTKSAVATQKIIADYASKGHYVNQDGTPTNPQRKLYLRITPLGVGTDKVFAVAVTIQPPLL